jgi:nucleoid-associated protein YgaU
MMDDFRQEKQDQPLDPLTEDSSLPLSRKVGLICFGVAVIGLFIFFTGDSWGSDSKKPQGVDELAHEVEQIKARLADLEQRSVGHVFAPTEAIADIAATQEAPAADAPAMANLKSLIEQELQEPGAATAEAPTAVSSKNETAVAQKKPAAKADAKQQVYTVKKGDTLSKIAQQFYGSPKKWRRIVEANKDKLGQSQVLRAGMTLVIPKDA